MRATAFVMLLAVSPAAAAADPPPERFAPPFAVVADGAVIDVPPGDERPSSHHNPFPWFGDFDGDSKPDLLVGQSQIDRKKYGRGGRLRIYKNIGERGKPRFGAPVMFDSLVPTGRIPDG